MNYKQYLLSEHWKELRLRKMRESGFRCEKCNGSNSLQVHHLHYRDILNAGLDQLQTLCELCHTKTHGRNTDTAIVRIIGIEAFDILSAFNKRAPTGSKNGRFNWAIKQTLKTLRESGSLTKALESALASLKK